MAGQKYELQFVGKINLEDIKSKLTQMQNQLGNLNLSKGMSKSFNTIFDKLQDEIRNFQSLAASGSVDQASMKSLISSYDKIEKLIQKIGIETKELNSLGIENLLPIDTLEKLKKINGALEQLKSLMDFQSTVPGQLADLGKQADESKDKISQLNKELEELNNKQKDNITKQTQSQTRRAELESQRKSLESKQEALRNEKRGVESAEYQKLVKEINKNRANISNLKSMLAKKEAELDKARRSTGKNKESNIEIATSNRDIARNNLNNANRLLEEQTTRRKQLAAQTTDGTQLKEYRDREKELERINVLIEKEKANEIQYKAAVQQGTREIANKSKEIEKEKENYNKIDQMIKSLESGDINTEKLKEIKDTIKEITGSDVDFDNIADLKQLLENLKSDSLKETTENLEDFNKAHEEVKDTADKNKEAVEEEADAYKKENEALNEITGIKNRIKAFLGLNNALFLVKRGIQSAFNTIKELDVAMTETAVVTEKTVSDMWKQLPEYTTRANQLGVTTVEAYRAATLYYQQGLNDRQAAELSTETLKMARIAGLDAAEATDRMTNALRGFNMELNAVNAQKVDDVYSKLAAMSASNVDEISTAMTKVASLAHNANMDFETTSAFLAQIIETTRESAETAGTALKTVVARFSEVKKLVDERQLRGTDEEGQTIDINKVSQALKTAGVDLNKYFLGEVGLDDIFMELASKWDSLTSVQQRYIATQAAGSRQQSRFIAMMQDYKRTQELVTAAYNAEGASAKQFEKTQESLQSKLARLKNAWNEFIMGIANSSIIKGAVDALTQLLNIVNKLTGAFGNGVGGFLKFGVAAGSFAGLKKVFSGGSIGDRLLGALGGDFAGLFKGKSKSKDVGKDVANDLKNGGKEAGEAMSKGGKEASESLLAVFRRKINDFKINTLGLEDYTQNPEYLKAKDRLKQLEGSYDESTEAEIINLEKTIARFEKQGGKQDGNTSLLKALGKKVGDKYSQVSDKFAQKGLGKFLSKTGQKMGMGASTANMAAFGATSAAVAIGIVALAHYAKKIKETTAAAKYEKMQKYADAIQNISDKTKAAAATMTEAKKKIKDYQNQINEAGNIQERRDIISDQNEYILSLLQKDSTYAQYIESTFTKDGQLYLTLDSDALAEACEKIAETAQKTQAYSTFAQAGASYRQAQVLELNKNGKAFANNGGFLGNFAGLNPGLDLLSIIGDFLRGDIHDLGDFFRSVVYSAIPDIFKNGEGGLGFGGTAGNILKEITGIDLESYIPDSLKQGFNNLIDSGPDWLKEFVYGDNYKSTQTRNQIEIENARNQAKSFVTLGAQQYIAASNLKLDPKDLDLIATVMGETFDLEKLQETTEQIQKDMPTDAAYLENEYKRLFGVDLEKGYNRDEVISAIAFQKSVEQTAGAEVPELAANIGDENVRAMFEIIAGTYEGTQEDINNVINNLTEDQLKFFGELLNVETEMVTHAEVVQTGVDSFTSAPITETISWEEESFDPIKNALSGKANDYFSYMQQFTQETMEGLYNLGVEWDTVSKIGPKLGKQQIRTLNKLQPVLQNYGKEFNNRLITAVVDSMVEETYDGSQLEKLVSHISDNEILTYQYLSHIGDYTADENIKTLAADLITSDTFKKPGAAESIQFYLASGEYQNLGQQIFDLMEANGKITSENIEELSKSSATLAAMLDMDIVSANGLARAMTAFEKGNITINDLNANIVRLYENFNTTAEILGDIDSIINNFNPKRGGESRSFNFLNDTSNKFTELVKSKKMGAAEDYFDFFFTGKAPSAIDIEGWSNYSSVIENLLGRNGLNFFTEALGFDWSNDELDLNIEDFKTSGANTYFDYVKDKANNYLKEQGLEGTFSDDFIKLMIDNARGQGKEPFEAIAEIELNNMMEAYGDSMPSKQQVQAIADGFDLKPQDVLNAWLQSQGKEADSIKIDDLDKQVHTSLYTLFNDIVEDQDKWEYSTASGINRDQFIKSLGLDKYGNFSFDQLKIKIKQIVPEVANGSMTAEEWLNNEYFNDDEPKVIKTTIRKVEFDEKENTYKSVELPITLTASSLEEAEEQYQKAIQDANIAVSGQTMFGSALAHLNKKISNLKGEIDLEVTSITIGRNISIDLPGAATGGVVKSAAKGTIEPGLALTGEEAPEIIWNGEKGYAYLAGKNGPEINNLQPGDRVFNGEQTKAILRRSRIHSFKQGTDGADSNGKVPYVVDSGSGGGGGNTGSSKDWKDSLDWLYDLMEDIAEEEHKQTLIQSEYELAEKDLSKTGRDLYNLTKSELDTLQAQLSAQQFAFEKRLQQMNELQQKVNAEGFQDYLQWNSEDNTLEIDWDKINEITDKDTYDKLSELVSDMEKVQDQMDEAQEATLDIKKQIQELQTRYLQAYLDFQNRVMEAVVAQYQQNIDSLSTLNDTINEANESILNSIQKEIDLQRQIRDNTDTEKEITDIEARLAMLQRDTTGANQQEILELQKQLDEARNNYSDTLIDQAIDRLSQNNSDAQEQREKQIELLEAQLEYWQETGALWEEVANLIAEGFTSQGSIIEGSTLWEFLKDKDSWKGLSQAQKDNWANELILESTQVGAYLIQLNDGTEVSTDRIIDSIIGEHGLAGEITAETRIVRAQLNELITKLGGTPIDSIPGDGGYASGGLATKTGLAMLHGSTNEPEYVLNARQTDAFLRLADVLPSIFGGNGYGTNNFGGNVYVELNMSVGEIGSDYDVDRLVARVKDDIYDASSYRNVNAVSFLR